MHTLTMNEIEALGFTTLNEAEVEMVNGGGPLLTAIAWVLIGALVDGAGDFAEGYQEGYDAVRD